MQGHLSPRATLDGAIRRPRLRPYPLDTNAPCVLVSHRPSHPVNEAPSVNPS